MGTISVNKLGGLALMAAPVITLIFFFLQPGGTFVDAADPADAGATIKAMVSNAGLGKVTSMLIPIGLLVFLYGIFVLQGNVRSNPRRYHCHQANEGWCYRRFRDDGEDAGALH